MPTSPATVPGTSSPEKKTVTLAAANYVTSGKRRVYLFKLRQSHTFRDHVVHFYCFGNFSGSLLSFGEAAH